MPRLCRCGAIVKDKCERCRPSGGHHGSASSRGYDRQWRNVRARYMADFPLCEDCEQAGRVTPAAQVHHKRTITEAPHLRLDRDNLRSLCVPCHQARHATPGAMLF